MLPLKIVLDSSVILKWLHKKEEKYLGKVEEILSDLESGRVKVIAPELVKYEVANVLLIAKKLTIPQAREALEFFYSIPITFIPDSLDLSTSAYSIGDSLKITYYDASFIALAKNLDTILVTDNPKHQKQIKGVKVVALKDYK